MHIKQFIAELLLEGFKDDQKELADKYSAQAPQIMQLDPPCISWLIKRFGKEKSIKETHPIEDCIGIVKSYKGLASGLSQKWATNEQFKTDIAAYYAGLNKEKSWDNPADFQKMTVDEMTTIMALASKKKQRLALTGSQGGPKELIGKVGPWNIWLPHNMADSMEIAGYDPITMAPNTTWCTNYTSQSNLFYTYNSGDKLLIYIIKDGARPYPDPAGKFDYMSIGFKDGKLIDGRNGGTTIDRDNKGMTAEDHKRVLGQYYSEIMKIIFEKVESIGGVAPAADYAIKAANNLGAMKEMLVTLSAQQRTEEAIRIYKDATSANVKFSRECAAFIAKFMTLSRLTYQVTNQDSNVLNELIKINADKEELNDYTLAAIFNDNSDIKIWPENAKNVFLLFQNVKASGDAIFKMLSSWNKLVDNQDEETKSLMISLGSPYAKVQKAYDMSISDNVEEIKAAYEYAKEKNYQSLAKNISTNPNTPVEIVLDMCSKSFTSAMGTGLNGNFWDFVLTNESFQAALSNPAFVKSWPRDVSLKIANLYIINPDKAPENKKLPHMLELIFNYGTLPYKIKLFMDAIGISAKNSKIRQMLTHAITVNKFLGIVPDESKRILGLNDNVQSANDQEIDNDLNDLFKENKLLKSWQKIIG